MSATNDFIATLENANFDDEEESIDYDAHEITAEYPVFVKKCDKGELVVLQFASLPASFDMNRLKVKKMFWKPEQKHLRIEYDFNPNDPNFDNDHPFASSFEYTANSTLIPLTTNYAAMAVRDGQVHLNAVNTMLRITPSHEFIDKFNAQLQEEARRAEELRLKSAQTQDANKFERVAVKVSNSAAENPRRAAARERSYAHFVEQRDAEPWRAVQSLAEPLGSKQLLCSDDAERVPVKQPTDTNWSAYADNLFPTRQRVSLADAVAMASSKGAKDKSVINSGGRGLPVLVQVSQIMRLNSIVRFSSVAERALRGSDDGTLIKALNKMAVLVCGRFICKSNLAMGDGTLHLQAARNLILYRFAQTDDPSRSQAHSEEQTISLASLCSELALLPERIVALLAPFAESVDGGANWRLQLQRDRDFESRYPAAVENWAAFWERNGTRIEATAERMTRGGKEATDMGEKSDGGVRNDALSQLDREGKREAFNAADVPKSLARYVAHMMKGFGVCTLELLKTTLETLKLDPTRGALLKPNVDYTSELEAVIRALCEELQPNRFCLRLLGDKRLDAYRKVVMELYRTAESIKRSAVNERVSQLGLDPMSSSIYSQVMREFGKSIGARWALKEGNGND